MILPDTDCHVICHAVTKNQIFFHHPNCILVRKETPDWGPDLSHSSRPQVGRSTRLDSAQVGISKSTWSWFCPSRGNISSIEWTNPQLIPRKSEWKWGSNSPWNTSPVFTSLDQVSLRESPARRCGDRLRLALNLYLRYQMPCDGRPSRDVPIWAHLGAAYIPRRLNEKIHKPMSHNTKQATPNKDADQNQTSNKTKE